MVSYVVKTSKTQNIQKSNITSQNTCSRQENLFQINSNILFNPLGLLTQDVGTWINMVYTNLSWTYRTILKL